MPFPQLMAEFGLSAPTADDYRVWAVALGAAGGVILANVATGGIATPVMALGAPAAAQGAAAYLGGLAATAIGAIGGGYLADLLYQR